MLFGGHVILRPTYLFVPSEIVFEVPEEIKPIQVAPSHTVEIVCETPDETTPATWYKDDVKLAPDDVKYETTTKERKRSLVIKDVKPDDAGKYVCEVGTHRTTAVVEVTKPKKEKKITGSPLLVTCYICSGVWASGGSVSLKYFLFVFV